MASNRKRGIKALLSVATEPKTTKRKAAIKSADVSAFICFKAAPRGMHMNEPEPETAEPEPEPHYGPVNLDSVFRKKPHILREGQRLLNEFIERNTTFVLQKIVALHIFATAVMDGDNISWACKIASRYSGFSDEVVRRWSRAFFLDYLGELANIDDADDSAVEAELDSSRGRHPKVKSLFSDEQFRLDAREFVKNVGYKRRKPNMTLEDFLRWIEEKWKVKVGRETARRWLHNMGFSYHQFSKGVYFDGHERQDVVEDRNRYLETLEWYGPRIERASLQSTPPSSTTLPTSSASSVTTTTTVPASAVSATPTNSTCLPGTSTHTGPTATPGSSGYPYPSLNPGSSTPGSTMTPGSNVTSCSTMNPGSTTPTGPISLGSVTPSSSCSIPSRITNSQPVISLFHDESTYYANADQSFHWSDGTSQVLKQKSLGQSIMVSDFIEEVDGFLKHDGVEARLYLEHQKDGYFNNEMLIEQVKKAMDIFDRKYPGHLGLFIFDNAPSHVKKAPNSLNPDHMNVKDGGKQPTMKDTRWNDSVQHMTLPDGTPKGMRTVLEERGINTKGMTADKLREELKKFDDFRFSPTILEEVVAARNHVCLYLPRFHCELNPIERCWCHSKKHTRANCNGSIIRLRKVVPEGLSMCSKEMIWKFFATCIDYENAYRKGDTCSTVDKTVKKYKSHRKKL